MELYELEDLIMNCWNTKNDLELLFKAMSDFETKITKDDISNAMLGIITLHDLKCIELFEKYNKLIKYNELKNENNF